MWNLILRTLRKKPDVTVVHSTENTRTFLVTITPPSSVRAAFGPRELEYAVENYLGRYAHDYKIDVQVIA